MIDAHTHLGLDEDGRSLTLEQLLRPARRRADARRACVFPLHDPERKPSYSVPNDRVLAWAARKRGQARARSAAWTPPKTPLAECERCLAAGARGIKLHPRAQDFVFDGARDGRASSRWPKRRSVPILIHAGRGLPPLADGLVDLALRHPGAVLILAHGAICDQGILTSRLADHPGVLYDISCFFPLDVIELFARVPAERIVFASDPPYGLPATTLYMALRVAPPGGARRGRPRRRCSAARWRRCSTAAELPAVEPRRGADPRSRCRGAWRACTATRASSVRPCSRGAIEQARAMLDMAIAACRDPDPGGGRRGARDDRRGAERGERAAGRRGRRAPRDRPRLPLDRARGHRAPRRRLDQPAAQPHGRPLAAGAPLALAQPEALGERARDLVDLRSQQAARDQVGGRRRASCAASSSSSGRSRLASTTVGWSRARHHRATAAPRGAGRSAEPRARRR